MLLDAFTIGAQIVNFLILVFLLQRFLYRPLVKAMNEREQRIAAQLQRAAETQRATEEQAEQLRHAKTEMAARRADMLQQAHDEVDAWRKQELAHARAQVDAAAARWQRALEQEQDAFLREVRERVTRETFYLARRALHDLADASLEQQIAHAFLARVRALKETERAAFARAARASRQPLRVQSAFEIPPTLREQISQRVREAFDVDAPIKFERAPQIIAGIELRADGYQIAWTLARYLDSLQENLEPR